MFTYLESSGGIPPHLPDPQNADCQLVQATVVVPRGINILPLTLSQLLVVPLLVVSPLRVDNLGHEVF